MKITFLGAAQTVTGSRYLVEHDNKKILIDCGLFQGPKELRQRNWCEFAVPADEIDAVLLTHAHIDHSGYIPLLVKQGFTGHIYCSTATLALCKILLPDSGYLHEEDARRANKYGYSKHKPALPLYTKDDAVQSLKSFRTVEFGKPYQLADELSFELSRSGHILGSSFVVIKTATDTLTFSGDMGRANDPVMNPPSKLQHTDYLVIESTYGNRLHEETDPKEELAVLINKTVARGGTVLIPAFAVGRTQSILYYLYQLLQEKKIQDVPIFIDSPMATASTKLLSAFKNEHNLGAETCDIVSNVATYVDTADDSKALNLNLMPKVIISASGMATGGRVLHHLKSLLGNHRNTIIFAGFQAYGTRGARLVNGEEEIKIHGEFHKVRAEIASLSNLSAHADYQEILDWLGNFTTTPKKVFVTHGEPEAAESMRLKIEERFNWQVIVPEYGQTEEL